MLQYIDLSQHNTMIDANINADGVILRIGYTGYISNKPAADKKFEKYYKIYHSAGVPIGVYYFTLACNVTMVDTETNWVLDQIKDKQIDLPVFVDVEGQEKSAAWTKLGKAVRSQLMARWCQNIQNAGYYAGIYANYDWLKNKLDASVIAPFDKWVAQYANTCKYTGKYDIWQYTNEEDGAKHGFKGRVDASIAYVDYQKIIKDAGLNHIGKIQTVEKSIDEIAQEVIDGKWGNGIVRKARLTSAGYDYKIIQSAVNRILRQK